MRQGSASADGGDAGQKGKLLSDGSRGDDVPDASREPRAMSSTGSEASASGKRPRGVVFAEAKELQEVKLFNVSHSATDSDGNTAGRCSSCQMLRRWCGFVDPHAEEARAVDGVELGQMGEIAQTGSILSGNLWKLNTGATDVDQNITNWRRRMFYLQRQDDMLALFYKSEKDNGKLTLAAVVHREDGQQAVLKMLDHAKEGFYLEKPSDEHFNKVCLDLFAYETSLGAKKDGPQSFKGQVPSVFYRFQVNGFDKDGEERVLILAAEKEKTRNTWFSLTDAALDKYQKRLNRNKELKK